MEKEEKLGKLSLKSLMYKIMLYSLALDYAFCSLSLSLSSSYLFLVVGLECSLAVNDKQKVRTVKGLKVLSVSELIVTSTRATSIYICILYQLTGQMCRDLDMFKFQLFSFRF